MEMYAFALQMEKDGENYYRELAANCGNPGLARIFTMLADEEVKHAEVIGQWQRKTSMPEVVDSPVLGGVRNIFQEMRAGKLDFVQGNYVDTTEATNAYRKARDIEEASREFYRLKAGETDDRQSRLLLEMLAREEDKHCRIMDTVVEFVSRPEPGNWLEDAEFYHLEEY